MKLALTLIALGSTVQSFATHPDILYSYTGNVNPSPSWTLSTQGATTRGPIIDTACGNMPAWSINNSVESDTGIYYVNPSQSEVDQATVGGWSLKVTLRVTGSNEGPGGSMMCLYRNGQRSYQMHFGSDANGDTKVVLINGTGAGSGDFFIVHTAPGSIPCYNTFELVSTTGGNADLFVNGVKQLTYAGFAYSSLNFGSPRVVAWGDGSTQTNPPNNFSAANYAEVVFSICGRPTLTQVAVKNGVALGTGGAKWNEFFVPAINPSGENAFRAKLKLGSGSPVVTALNDEAIWAGPLLPLVVREGSPAPCVTGAVFSSFSEPVLNNLNNVAFRGLLLVGPLGGVTPLNKAGLWSNAVSSGVLTLHAREGVASPECGFPPCVPDGAKYKLIKSLAMPDGGGVAFVATLVHDTVLNITSANDLGLWRSDLNGDVDLLLRKGDMMTVNSSSQTVSDFIVLPTNVPCVSGTGRTLERSGGKITCLIKFVSGKQGIFNL